MIVDRFAFVNLCWWIIGLSLPLFGLYVGINNMPLEVWRQPFLRWHHIWCVVAVILVVMHVVKERSARSIPVIDDIIDRMGLFAEPINHPLLFALIMGLVASAYIRGSIALTITLVLGTISLMGLIVYIPILLFTLLFLRIIQRVLSCYMAIRSARTRGGSGS